MLDPKIIQEILNAHAHLSDEQRHIVLASSSAPEQQLFLALCAQAPDQIRALLELVGELKSFTLSHRHTLRMAENSENRFGATLIAIDRALAKAQPLTALTEGK